MPPPLPRSSTVSPSESSASAVGLPHPRDASIAVSGISDASFSEYRSFEMGLSAVVQQELADGFDSPQQESPFAAVLPQQDPLFPSRTRMAASPYLCFTSSRTLSRSFDPLSFIL